MAREFQMASLSMLWKTKAHYKPFRVIHVPSRRRATVLGAGPGGKFVYWYDGTQRMSRADPDEKIWAWLCLLGKEE